MNKFARRTRQVESCPPGEDAVVHPRSVARRAFKKIADRGSSLPPAAYGAA